MREENGQCHEGEESSSNLLYITTVPVRLQRHSHPKKIFADRLSRFAMIE